jgi:hypothetical protein
MINTVLSGLTGTRCFVFLDDKVIYEKSLSEHDAKLREVFGRIRKHNLKLQPDNCKFLRTEVSYLGHMFTEEGIRPDPDRAIAQAISRLLPNAAARVRSRGLVRWDLRWTKWRVFSDYFGFPCQSSFHQILHHHNYPG